MSTPLDPALTIGPVATEIARLRDEAKPLIVAAARSQLVGQDLTLGTLFDEEIASNAEAREAFEAIAIQVGVVAYLEEERKRRAEWEARVETRLNEVRHATGFDRAAPESVTPPTERNT